MAAVDAPSPPFVETPGRQLAARALLAGPDRSQQRVSDVLGVSRRTIGRMVDADLTAALRDPQALKLARTCLEETASRGSTADEREAAVAWLEEAARDEHQVEAKPAAVTPPGSTARRRKARVPARRPTRHGAHRNGSAKAGRPSGNSDSRNTGNSPGASDNRDDMDPPAPAPLPQIDALRRQQQRVLHRSTLIACVLAAEQRGGDPLTMGDALAELLADITEAARTIGTLLQTATGRP